MRFYFKNSSAGITIIEIVVACFIIALFSTIIIVNFPKILKQSALSRVSYKLAQDLRRTQDLGLSGIKILDASGNQLSASGYGIYVNPTASSTKYLIYADVKPGSSTPGDSKYNGNFTTSLCSALTPPITTDCVVEIIDVSQENPDLYIKQLNNVTGTYTSINFSPPGPTVNIENLDTSKLPPNNYTIGIVLGITSDASASRTVQANTSGLINVQ